MKSRVVTSLRRTATRSMTATAGVILLLGLTACSPGSDSGKELKTDDNVEAAMLDWRDKIDSCMKAAGFDLNQGAKDGESSPTVDTSQFDMAEFDKAYDTCSDKVGEPPVDESLPSEQETFDSQLIFAECMRKAGYDYPDPVKGSGMAPSFTSDINSDDVDACTAKASGQVAPK